MDTGEPTKAISITITERDREGDPSESAGSVVGRSEEITDSDSLQRQQVTLYKQC